MVGIVVVSHSAALAQGVVRLAREMAGGELALEAAGGIEEADVLGTDAERVRGAIARAMSDSGVLVLMDLGSALMSAELAIELLEDSPGPVRLSPAPLVEGTVAAAVCASGGATLEEVAAEAAGALAMKAAQISDEDRPPPPPSRGESEAGTEVRAELSVRNEIGLHARPAARFVQIARGFDAEVRVAKRGGGAPVSAISLTNLVALGARRGDTLVLTARGPQAAGAVAALTALADDGFGDGVVTEASATRPTEDAPRPAVEEEAPVPPEPGEILRGVPAGSGVVIGPVHRLGGHVGPPPDRAVAEAAEERRRLQRGLASAREAIERDRGIVAERAGVAEAEIFDAHLALLDDEALLAPAAAAIDRGLSAERAWYDAAAQVAMVYRTLPDPLVAARATDVLDVGRRVVAALTGEPHEPAAPGGVIISEELTPADAAALDPESVLGIATARGSATAHAAILARALGLPAVVGLGAGVLAIAEGTPVMLDGQAGTLTVSPPRDTVRAAQARRAAEERRRAAAREAAGDPAVTTDGVRVEVFANLGAAGEAAPAVALGAEGVGLLRTEFLFLGRATLPGEEEQTETLRQIALALAGRPLVVRTLDAGADKPLASLPMPPEDNPFLGVRGIRLALAHREVLATQLRAILRVAAEHPVKVMLPMVTTLDEILAARAALSDARAATGIDTALELGIMVEVPAAALTAERLAAHVDFFSLGTNDLTQYTMAAERGDPRLASLLAGPQPAVLRLVRETVRAARQHGRWVGVCGELAGDPAAALLLVGLGVSELSMASGLIPEVKAAVRGVALADARAAAQAALESDSAEAARAFAVSLL
jgi:phosphoenolpyruvate-protein phosphotransferase/dihydroxyacetone kinase phosphotransfer subunit